MSHPKARGHWVGVSESHSRLHPLTCVVTLKLRTCGVQNSDSIKHNVLKIRNINLTLRHNYEYVNLHWRLRITDNHPLAVTELGVHYGDVPQGDVLVDEVPVHVALDVVRQLGPADAAGVGGAQE